MKGLTRAAIVLALVLVLTISMAAAAVAAPSWVTVNASDPGWTTSGTWRLERYSLALPGVGSDLQVANDAGATISYTIPAGTRQLQVASATYWNCGIAEVYLNGALVATVDLRSETTTWGKVIYNNSRLNPAVPNTVTIRATGTGGPGMYEFNGNIYDLTWMHFVNVQYIRYK